MFCQKHRLKIAALRIAALKHRIVIRKLNIAHPHTLLGQLLTFANTV